MPRKQTEEKQLVAERPFVCFVDGRVVHVGEGVVVLSTDPVAALRRPYLRELS
jgi:hypothetical protein